MGFWDVLRGRTKTHRPDLDSLFSLPSAALSLEAALGVSATGTGAVCFRAAEGPAAASTQQEAQDLVASDGGPVTQSRVDEYGYTWLTVRTDPPDVPALVTDLHAVNSSLETQGFASGLLCSTASFRLADGATAYLVYLYQQGTFYPFCPTGPSTRNALLERQVRDVVASDLPIESDLGRWMPLWGLRD